MADWLIKGLRTIAAIIGLSTVGGGVFYLQNSNNIKEQKVDTIIDKDDDNDLSELGEQVFSTGKKGPISRPVLEDCKKKWNDPKWERGNDKCGNIYIAKEEEDDFWVSL